MAKKRKVHSLTGRITLSLVRAAWRAVRRNRGAAGIDKVSVKMFEANLDENLQALMRDLKNGSFEPKPLRRVYIPKDAKKTKLRPLGIPAVRELTQRHRNLDAKVVEKLNQVIRGTANYFATGFSTCLRHFLALDKWIRMRVRCMKLKRKSYHDNYKLRMAYFEKLGLLNLSDFV